MDEQEFRTLGHEIIDWIADYLRDGYPGRVLPLTEPGELLDLLPSAPPREGEDGRRIWKDFQELVLPRTTHWNDPRFFAYFPCNNSGPSILGELLSAALDVNAMSWATSPAATELEIRMISWLGGLIGLPWPGTIQDTASTGTLCALLSAREHLCPFNAQGGYAKRPLVCYASDQAHSSVLKAVRIAGLGEEHLRSIPSRDDFSMDPALLRQAVLSDREKGLRPCFATATVGTTSSLAVDPVADIAQVCRSHGIWLHVDAAMAGSAAILPEMKWLMEGVDQADSFLFNPHKWLFTNFDCCAYFCKSPDLLKKALGIQPEYLKTAQDARVENFRDWSIQLGRRFRALKLWFVLRSFGVEGLREKLRLHLRMAQWFKGRIEGEERTILAAPARLSTVCFRLEDDARTEALLERINAGGEAYLTHTKLAGRYVIRVSFGQTQSRFEHAERLWRLIRSLLREDVEVSL